MTCKYSELNDHSKYLDISSLNDLCFWLNKKDLLAAYNKTENDTFKGFKLVNPFVYRFHCDGSTFYFDTLEELNQFEKEKQKEIKNSFECWKEWVKITYFSYKEFDGFSCENYKEL